MSDDARTNSLRMANRELSRHVESNSAILKDIAAVVQKAMGGFTPNWHDLPDLVRAIAEDLEKELTVRAMTVGRLGGTVEGRPTHSGNFLQRIDELRKIEEREAAWHNMVMDEAAELGLDWHDYGGIVPGDFKALIRELRNRWMAAEEKLKEKSRYAGTPKDAKP